MLNTLASALTSYQDGVTSRVDREVGERVLQLVGGTVGWRDGGKGSRFLHAKCMEQVPEQEPFSLISRGAWLCLSPSLTLTDATQTACDTLHFPVQLFCLVVFFPFDSKSSRGDQFENFSGAWCVCVCGVLFTHGGSLTPSTVDDVPSHPFSVHPPLPTHPLVPSISWSCI